MSVEVKWTDKGATISSLNAVKEFPVLTNEDVEAAIEDGRLDTRQGSFMGKTYTKLLRHQVKKLAKETEKKQKKLGKGGEEEDEEEEEEEEVEKREPKWSDKGATISDKNAIKEFPGLTMELIESALESGELESRNGNFMGKTYRKLLLHQVQALAAKLDDGNEDNDDSNSSAASERQSTETCSGGGDRKKRMAEIDEQLEKLESKKKKLMEEKKSLEKE